MAKRDHRRDDELDRLIEGTSDRPELSGLIRALDAMRAKGDPTVDDDLIASYVDEAVTASLRLASRPRPGAGASRRRFRLLGRPAMIGLASMLVLVIGMSGAALAANGSKPGDSLYGLDRAFEAIGIGNGGAEERLSEARALFVSGDLTRMLDHITHVVPAEAEATMDATQALRAAAESMRSRAITSGETLTGVSELLSYLTNNLDRLDAAKIASIAGHIRTRDFDPPDAGLTPADPADPSGFKER